MLFKLKKLWRFLTRSKYADMLSVLHSVEQRVTELENIRNYQNNRNLYFDRQIGELRSDTDIHKELLKLPITRQLAQCKKAIEIQTSFLNEIQDQVNKSS